MHQTFAPGAHSSHAEGSDRQHPEQVEKIINSPAHKEAAEGLQDKEWAHGGLQKMMNLQPSEATLHQHKMGNAEHMMAQTGPGSSHHGNDALKHGQHGEKAGHDDPHGKHAGHPEKAGHDDPHGKHEGHGGKGQHGHLSDRNGTLPGQDASQLANQNPGALSVDQLTSLAASNPGMVAAMGATPDVLSVAQNNPALRELLISQNPQLADMFGGQAATLAANNY